MDDIFGSIENPTSYGDSADGGAGFFSLLSNIFLLAGTIAGLFFVVQIISAGYGYISANGDQKKTEAAWAKIYQSLIGLLIVSSAFVLAPFISEILGINNILTPIIYGPDQ